MKQLICALLLSLSYSALAQQAIPYQIFTATGKATSYEKMIRETAKADVVCFGEIHDNSLNHWLELRVTRDLYAVHGEDLVLAMEMFEADNQIVIDEYMSGLIEEKHLLKEAKLWNNYQTDYRPLLEFAKEQQLKMLATNIPRRYASLVYRKGLAALAELAPEARAWMPPLPLKLDLSLPGYKEMMESMAGHGGPGGAENMAYSQASKDATMAWFISKALPAKVLHFNGSFHSKNGEGILLYLSEYARKADTATIHCVLQDNLETLEASHLGLADFIIVIASDMNKTY